MKERLGKLMPCPTCGYRTDTNSAVGPMPLQSKAGDASICLRCGQLLLLELDMVGLRFRLPTVLELVDLRANPTIEQLLESWVSAFHRTPETRTA
ncbi:MAG: hypothetical protein HIU88_10125 [Acidobacteria bacterium]|nr:hypothetical protein [Acidobacteriota bacterium]